MPKIAVFKFYVLILFGVDINEARKHIHVSRTGTKNIHSAKFWMEPKIELVKAGDFKKHELKEVAIKLEKHKSEIIEQIENFYAGKKVTLLDLND